jgi:hypothetical protein
MSNTTKRRCAQCGERAVVKVKGAGRVRTYKNLDLEVPAHVEIPTCENCGAEWIGAATAGALDTAMETVYEETQRERLDEALGKILEHESNQTRIERALNVSPGYLSKLKHERRVPSGLLVSALDLMSEDPEHALVRLESRAKREKAKKRAAG